MQMAALECQHTLLELTLQKNPDGNGWDVTFEPPPLKAIRVSIEEECDEAVVSCDRTVFIARLKMVTNYGTWVRENYVLGREHILRLKVTRVPKPITWWDEWRIPVCIYAICFSALWVFWDFGQAMRSMTFGMFLTWLATWVRKKLEQKDREEQNDSTKVQSE